MNRSNLFNENCFSACGTGESGVIHAKISSKQCLKTKFDKERLEKEDFISTDSSQVSRTGGSWCDALSLPKTNVNAKQAWKNGTEKLSQTFNNMKTTIGTISQKIKKSKKRRQPLVNLESPKTPVTPYTRSKALLGRTPTKLYSPFRIDTPTGKENFLERCNRPGSESRSMGKKKLNNIVSEPQFSIDTSYSPEKKFSTDLLQTQIGIYEFQSIANRIVKNNA